MSIKTKVCLLYMINNMNICFGGGKVVFFSTTLNEEIILTRHFKVQKELTVFRDMYYYLYISYLYFSRPDNELAKVKLVENKAHLLWLDQ